MEFLTNFLAVAEKVGLLFLIIMVGFVCQRKGMLTEAANKGIGDLVMYIVTPCVIIYAFSATLYAQYWLTMMAQLSAITSFFRNPQSIWRIPSTALT